METKEMKIVPPEGFEIDKENSTFECIKFKPIKKALTYEDVAKELFFNKTTFYTNTLGEIISSQNTKAGLLQPNNSTSEKQMQKLFAINKLMNVAKYLNDGWQPNYGNDKEYKYWIGVKECYNKDIYIEHSSSYNFSYVYFKSEELAQQAIDILGEETIRLALSTDW